MKTVSQSIEVWGRRGAVNSSTSLVIPRTTLDFFFLTIFRYDDDDGEQNLRKLKYKRDKDFFT